METQEKQTITLDGKNHIVEDLSDAARYFLEQIQDIQVQIKGARARVDQLIMAEKGFLDMLRAEVAEPPVEVVDEE